MWEWYAWRGGEIIPEPAADGVCVCVEGQRITSVRDPATAGSRVERVPLTVKQLATANPPASWRHPICSCFDNLSFRGCRLQHVLVASSEHHRHGKVKGQSKIQEEERHEFNIRNCCKSVYENATIKKHMRVN